jgi:hypothetical protein
MNENSTIKKMVSGILQGRKNASYDRHIMHPEREWFVAVFIGLVLFAIGISWNVSTHLQFKNVAISTVPESEETVVYRESLVESALADFETRKRQYEELKQSLLEKRVAVPVVPEVITPVGEQSTTTEESVEDSTESVPAEVDPSIPEESVVLPPSAPEDLLVTDQPVI